LGEKKRAGGEAFFVDAIHGKAVVGVHADVAVLARPDHGFVFLAADAHDTAGCDHHGRVHGGEVTNSRDLYSSPPLTKTYGGAIMHMQHRWRKNMDRTTIMLPPELKTRASNQAKKMRISLGQYIREALNKSLEMENRREAEDDPLFLDNAVFDSITPEDLASNHDRYLYGDEK